MNERTFAISFANIKTGEAILDCGTSSLKTAKGAARNWFVNIGHSVNHFVNKYPGQSHDTIYAIVRPIEFKEDAVCINVETMDVSRFIEREERHGATVLTLWDILNNYGSLQKDIDASPLVSPNKLTSRELEALHDSEYRRGLSV